MQDYAASYVGEVAGLFWTCMYPVRTLVSNAEDKIGLLGELAVQKAIGDVGAVHTVLGD